MINNGEILVSILQSYKDCFFFLHNTREQKIVEIIMHEGFIFENQLPHSTDQVNPNEPVEVDYFLCQRKEYGNFTIIIAIPKKVYEMYMELSNKNNIAFEEVVTIKKPSVSDNDELLYTISPKHILGCFNLTTSEFYPNRNWDPLFVNSKKVTLTKRPSNHKKNDNK